MSRENADDIARPGRTAPVTGAATGRGVSRGVLVGTIGSTGADGCAAGVPTSAVVATWAGSTRYTTRSPSALRCDARLTLTNR